MIKKILHLLETYMHHLLSVTFFIGFAIDIIFLPKITDPLYPLIGLFYIAFLIPLFVLKEYQLHLLSIGRGKKIMYEIYTYATSFVLGSLVSYVFIYYMRSGDIYTSWPLYAFLLGCVFINEFSFQTSTKFLVNVVLFFTSISFYSIFNLPLVKGYVSDRVFFESVIYSFVIIFFLALLFSLALYAKRLTKYTFLFALLIPLFIAGTYYTRLLPAVPLSMRNADIYSKVSKIDGEYQFVHFDKSLNERFLHLNYKTHIYNAENKQIYFYASVVAPGQVRSDITHVWEKYDANSKSWKQVQKISFPVVGGREDGYRGFTILNNATKGEYRVLIQVGNNRRVGEKKFVVES